jgi:hypothetical protein
MLYCLLTCPLPFGLDVEGGAVALPELSLNRLLDFSSVPFPLLLPLGDGAVVSG